ncbi:MAG: hypothetical protein PHW79_00940 [Candidatus Marinimicrobia bacterium]|nr:hypothetical protein [Candidatus Neomarinimicrobiota bacterium]
MDFFAGTILVLFRFRQNFLPINCIAVIVMLSDCGAPEVKSDKTCIMPVITLRREVNYKPVFNSKKILRVARYRADSFSA